MQGRSEEVALMYQHKPSTVTVAMEDGRRIHEEIATHITEHKRFPDYLPQIPLLNPLPEEKHVVAFNDMIDISGVYDLLDEETLYEFKTGTQDSLRWSGTFQIPIYFLIAQIKKIPIKRAFLIHYNQHTSEKDFVMIYNNPTAVRRAVNLIETIGPEIYDYFDKEGLLHFKKDGGENT